MAFKKRVGGVWLKDKQHSERYNSLFELPWYIQWAEGSLCVALSSVV
jgi:hypothetical protein